MNIDLRLRPMSNLSISLGPRIGRNEWRSQFVRSFDDPTATHFAGRRVVFADFEQHTIGMDTRLAMTFTPNLTLEVFAQPLLSSGSYAHFKEFEAIRGLEKSTYGPDRLTPVLSSAGDVISYSLDADRDPATEAFTFDNPDFNLRSLRGNAVLRWEYLPGSTLYFVWQQSRSGSEPLGDLDFRRDAAGIFEEDADNIFVIKASYWFGR